MTPVPIDDQTPRSRTPIIALQWLALIVITAAAIWGGYRARVWQFVVTQPTHFVPDVTRNWMWGSYTWANIYDKGRTFLDTYDDLGIQHRDAGIYCDYAPLRLAVFTLWAASDERKYPDRHFQPTRDFHAFYVDFNMTMELIGALGAFMLVRAVVRRSRILKRPHEPWWTFTGAASGLAAALIIWFNPAMWLSAHSWPGGDSWIIPPFLWAVYFCVGRRWFIAGLVLAAGALFKGQQFIIAPMFILWPLFQGRPLAALRVVCGIVALFGLATVGWTLTFVAPDGVRHISNGAAAYVISIIAAAAVLPLLRDLRWLARAEPPQPQAQAAETIVESPFREYEPAPAGRRRRTSFAIYAAIVLLAIAALSWPLLVPVDITNGTQLQISRNAVGYVVLVFTVVGTLAVCLIPRRQIAVAVATLAGAGALLSMLLFNTSFAWFDAGYQFGPDHWELMVMGKTSNLPGILENRFGWRGDNIVNVVQTTIKVFGYSIDITLRRLFVWAFTFLLIISSAGVAMHDRRRSTRLLIAVCTPWLLFFCIPAQIHERYLLFGAAASAICIGDSVGVTLLGIFLSAVTWIMTMSVLNLDPWRRTQWDRYLAGMYPSIFAPDTTFAHSLERFLLGTFPDIGWAVLLATGVFLYFSVTPLWAPRSRRKIELNSPQFTEPAFPSSPPPRDAPLPTLDSIPLE